MNDFYVDDAFQKRFRERHIVPLYVRFQGMFLFPRWRNAIGEDEQSRGDAIFTLRNGNEIGIEEKIVRWPKKDEPYTAIPLEFMSCSIPGREKAGWMITAKYDWLIHVRTNIDASDADCDAIHFHKLREWYAEQNHTRWHVDHQSAKNRTKNYIVPLDEIRNAVPTVQFTLSRLHSGTFEKILNYEYRRKHFEHHCHCGKWGSFGHGVNLLAGQVGEWFCNEHNPTNKQGETKA